MLTQLSNSQAAYTTSLVVSKPDGALARCVVQTMATPTLVYIEFGVILAGCAALLVYLWTKSGNRRTSHSKEALAEETLSGGNSQAATSDHRTLDVKPVQALTMPDATPVTAPVQEPTMPNVMPVQEPTVPDVTPTREVSLLQRTSFRRPLGSLSHKELHPTSGGFSQELPPSPRAEKNQPIDGEIREISPP